MKREFQLEIIPLALAIFFVVGGILLLLRELQFKSVTTTQPVNIDYILSSKRRNELPFGGTEVFPRYRYLALYGSPLYDALGVLGEQSIEASIKRTKTLAAQYQKYSTETIVPSMEIITTVASEGPTANSDYSQETDVSKLRPWVDAAKDAQMYVLLDLQPGRRSFLSQVKQYKELLLEPHVGLALDPEWRLGNNELHLQQIGSVASAEINEVSSWLADLISVAKLPQKMLLIHQFRQDMIKNPKAINTSHEELAIVIQMDGQGTVAGKNDTYEAITAVAPTGVYFGWKNFYDEDTPTRSPADTMRLSPKPWFISYQ